MPELTPMAPLAAFRGQKPPAPAWFERVVAIEPERSFVAVDGARVETLAWGERGKPGLIFLHGGAAHADWWSFIAPFFARERRVVAPIIHRHGALGLARRLRFPPVRPRSAGSGARGGRVRGRAPGRGRPFVRRPHRSWACPRFWRRARRGRDGRPTLLRPEEPAQTRRRPGRRRGSIAFDHRSKPSSPASASRRHKPATICSFSILSRAVRRERRSTPRAIPAGR